MTEVWPATLPRPERDTWQAQPQEARRKRQPDNGPPAYRRRFSSVARMVSLSVLLTRDEKAVFDHFYHSVCAEGAAQFYLPDPTTDGWELLSSDGETLLTRWDNPVRLSARWLCLWGDTPPAETLLGIEFRKSFSVVVMP
ncbi:hypothetical protein JI664_22405 [Rhodobacter sp. NTK016B]|uniref:hypothetical protein n=1 Tax=Rhodobacter sp. NTK016B TaxID=2759676 RepID=UPI001A8EC5A5|nr:hypothetical protein [Rhodobacter sp. NTK016B]MBN8294739.1 hypothetical protein [Rhodobacter sp. NTK016B]